LLTPPRFRFTHRAFAAAESFALVAADILFPPVWNAERDKAVPRSEARRCSKVPIIQVTIAFTQLSPPKQRLRDRQPHHKMVANPYEHDIDLLVFMTRTPCRKTNLCRQCDK
jgi:hypothetical protein